MSMALIIAACGGPDSATSENGTDESDAAVDGGAADDMTFDADDVPSCESFIGQPTDDVANYFQDGSMCGRDAGLDDLELFSPGGVASDECVDGTFVYWNDTGWGATGGTSAEGELPPADVHDACLGR